MQTKVPEKKAIYIAQKICNKMRKQPFCISGLYVKGEKFEIGTKTKECGQFISQKFKTRDNDTIYFQFYWH